MRLGELLINEGLISPAELEEALKMQVIFGGRLGTNLIEMGILGEDDIARVLSRKLRVPYADPSELMEIPAQVIAAVPREIAERHKVIPLRLENRRLTLAMANPADLRAVDEIAFRTGFVVQPAVTPEVRLIQALEKHYQISRDLRYIPVSRTPVARRPPTAPPAASQPPPPPKAAADLPDQGAKSASIAGRPAPPVPPAPPGAPIAPARPAPAAAAPASPVAVPTAAPTAVRPASPPGPSPAAARPAPPPPPALKAEPEVLLEEVEFGEEAQQPGAEAGLDAVARELAEAASREDIADLAIGWAGARFGRAALFLVRPDGAQGWRAAVDRRPAAGFERLRIPFNEPSVLKTVADTRSWYLGPIPRTPFNSLFLQELGGGVPQNALLLPLLMVGRVIAILYVDGQNAALQEQLLDLQKLAAKVVMAFEILVLKNKIVML